MKNRSLLSVLQSENFGNAICWMQYIDWNKIIM